MPEFIDRVVEHVDRIEAFIDRHRPSLRFVYLDKGEKNVQPVACLGAFSRAPGGLDLGERGPVIFVRTDRPDFHRLSPSRIAIPSAFIHGISIQG